MGLFIEYNPMDLFYIVWNPAPELIDWGFFTLRWYGFFWALSLLFIDTMGGKICQWEGVPNKTTSLLAYSFIGGIIGARLAEVVFYNPAHFLLHPEEIVMIWNGGLASHGGVVGSILGIYLFHLRNKSFPFVWLLDRSAILIIFAAGLIRLGNLFNSELVGYPTDLPWAFIFSNVDQIPRHPTPLYEAIAYILLFIVVFALYRRNSKRPTGTFMGLFLVLTFGIRFLIEFTKASETILIEAGNISLTQVLSLPMIAGGIIVLLMAQKGYFDGNVTATSPPPST